MIFRWTFCQGRQQSLSESKPSVSHPDIILKLNVSTAAATHLYLLPYFPLSYLFLYKSTSSILILLLAASLLQDPNYSYHNSYTLLISLTWSFCLPFLSTLLQSWLQWCMFSWIFNAIFFSVLLQMLAVTKKYSILFCLETYCLNMMTH